MIRRWRVLLGAAILACAPWPVLAAAELSAAADLRAEATQAASAGGPLILIYSRADCKFCQTVKRDYLLPLAADPKFAKRVVIREIGQDRDTPLRDFAGQATSHARFASSQKIKLVPVVAFYGPGGQTLAEPIIGARLPDFYQSYLDKAIEQASQALRKP